MGERVAVNSIICDYDGKESDLIGDFVQEAETYFALDTPLYWDFAEKSTGSTGPFMGENNGRFMVRVAEVIEAIRNLNDFKDLTPVVAYILIDAMGIFGREQISSNNQVSIRSIINNPITPSHELCDDSLKQRKMLLRCVGAVRSIEQGGAKPSDYELLEDYLEVKKGCIGATDMVLANKLGRFRHEIDKRRRESGVGESKTY